MKISILTPDFSNNCFGRAWLLAKILQKPYDVELIGPAFGPNIWEPLRNACNFETKILKGNLNGHFEFKKMLHLVSGDVIYASKPLLASFGVGIVKKIITRKPLILDIDDWELGVGKEFYDSLIWPKKINDFVLSISKWRSRHYKVILNRLVWLANAVTVSGKTLQKKYGGTIISHGRDINTFNQKRFNKAKLKKKYLSEKAQNLHTIGFIGTPRPHKGLEDLINAIAVLDNENILLMIVGLGEDSYCRSLKTKIQNSNLKERVALFPEQPFDRLPEFLSIADLIVIPQRRRPISYGQVPAKIFDAMAMAKPIIATNVSDIPKILNGCGWLVTPEEPKQLEETIEYIFNHQEEAKETGERAREKCKSEYSWEVIAEKLISVIQKYETR
jgi:glycosyltransferase involved in cell wall biosynthesis